MDVNLVGMEQHVDTIAITEHHIARMIITIGIGWGL
jgi:hypothetical protein